MTLLKEQIMSVFRGIAFVDSDGNMLLEDFCNGIFEADCLSDELKYRSIDLALKFHLGNDS